jgi:hypothetical protein
MGKSVAALSLLLHVHSRAPKLGIFFGGGRFGTGEEYYDHLAFLLAGPEKKKLAASVRPQELAAVIVHAVTVSDDGDEFYPGTAIGDRRTGRGPIPGLRDFLYSPEMKDCHGGTPMLVFEDVNISLSSPRPGIDPAEQEDAWFAELEDTARFFNTLMMKAYELGVVVFVTTNSIKMAKFLSMLNDNEKAKLYKARDGRGGAYVPAI